MGNSIISRGKAIEAYSQGLRENAKTIKIKQDNEYASYLAEQAEKNN